MKKKLLTLLTPAVLLGSLIMIILGICRQEQELVLRKAIRVCIECIGLQ